MKFKIKSTILIFLLLLSTILASSCGSASEKIDPSDWGYTCKVFYNTLGGIINQREIRETYYLDNSYVYRPSGKSGFLVEPQKDGSVLAGWYTAKEDILDEEGNVTGYNFKAENRWDFSEDRINGNITLYARWIKLETVDYVNPNPQEGNKELIFTKNISTDYGIIPLSPGLEEFYTPEGYTLYDYYEDKECTVLYDFTKHENKSFKLDDRTLYVQLAEEFPQWFAAIEGFVWNEKTQEQDDINEESIVIEEEIDNDKNTTNLYIEKVGFRLITSNEDNLKQIKQRKNEIYESQIKSFEENNIKTVVYMKFIEGNYIRVSKTDIFNRNGKYYFDAVLGTKQYDGYIINTDLNFEGIAFEKPSSFTGAIYGKGHTIKNVSLVFNNGKAIPENPQKIKDFYGLFTELNDSLITDITFENITIAASEKSGNSMAIGLLAGNAVNTKVENCNFINIIMRTGESQEKPLVHQQQENDTIKRQAYFGDIFGESKDCDLNNNTYIDWEYKISGTAEVVSALFE